MSSAISLVGGRLFPLLDTKYRIPKKSRESNVNERKNKLEKKLPRTPRDNGKKSMTSIKRGIRNGLNTNPTLSQYGPANTAIILGQSTVSSRSNSGNSATYFTATSKRALNPTRNKSKKMKGMRI